MLFASAKCHAVTTTEPDGGASGGNNGGNQTLVHDSGQHHQGNIAGLRIGDAQAVYEIAFLAQKFERSGEGRTAAMHDGDFVAIFRQLNDGASALVQRVLVLKGRAAELDHDLHCRPSCSLKRYMRFIF